MCVLGCAIATHSFSSIAGKAVILCQSSKKEFFKKFLYEPLPVEVRLVQKGFTFELRLYKPCLRGVRPGLTQTGLYSHRRCLGLKFRILEGERLYNLRIYVVKTNVLIS